MLAPLLIALLAASEVHTTSEPVVRKAVPLFSLVTDAGLPDGLGASLGVRPLRMLRLELGVIGNGLSTGARGGFTFIPFQSVFRPTLTAEVGHYFAGRDAGVYANRLPDSMAAVLTGLHYDYGNAQLGFEVGSSNFSFFLRAGVSYVSATVPGIDSAAAAFGASASPVALRAFLPSAKLGLVFSVL